MSSISKKLSVVKSFFSWLTDEELITKDPARRIKPPKKEQRLPKALTIEELELIRETCITPRERALVEVLYATGSRLSEVQQLNKEVIDYQAMSTRVIGKGNKEREVYLSFKALYHLKKYLMSRLDDAPALFITERQPYRRLSNRGIQRAIAIIAKRSGIQKKIHPHTFRHTFATLTLNNGADLSSVQALLGHADPASTQVYAQVSETKKREAYRKHLVQ
jgi:integrase/recombinase XerD